MIQQIDKLTTYASGEQIWQSHKIAAENFLKRLTQEAIKKVCVIVSGESIVFSWDNEHRKLLISLDKRHNIFWLIVTVENRKSERKFGNSSDSEQVNKLWEWLQYERNDL